MPAELDRISDSETELDSDMIVEEDYPSNKELLAMLGTGLFIMTAIVFGLCVVNDWSAGSVQYLAEYFLKLVRQTRRGSYA